MNLHDFKKTLSGDSLPQNLSQYLKALWFDGKEEWEKAHVMIQDIDDKNAAWIHAYLHRKEGDISNADYWYNRAGKKRPDIPLEKEWEQIAEAFL